MIEYGNRVVVVDNKDVPDDIALEGDKTFFIKSDLSNPDNCKEVVKSALEYFRGIDILINSAGFQTVSSPEQFPEDVFKNMMNLMAVTPLILSKMVFP